MSFSARPRSPRRFWKRRLIIYCGLLAVVFGVVWWMVGMPGKSHSGALPALTAEQAALREEMKRDLQTLAVEIGERNVLKPKAYEAGVEFIERAFREAGLEPRRESYEASRVLCHNVIAEVKGKTDEIVVVGAHHDTVAGCPGANDNGSGVVGTLALARRFADRSLQRTLRFVAFANEEPVHFQSELMGSWVHAHGCRQRGEKITAMISLETIGYFSHEPGSQNYPVPLLKAAYPSQGNFIAFVGDLSSRELVEKCVRSFRQHAQFPSEGASLPAELPGIGWSDHWSFWQHGYQGLMVTDTAPFRYPHYHLSTDTPDRVDFASMARVVAGMEQVIAELAGE